MAYSIIGLIGLWFGGFFVGCGVGVLIGSNLQKKVKK